MISKEPFKPDEFNATSHKVAVDALMIGGLYSCIA